MRLCLLLLLSSLGAQAQPFFNTFVDSLLKEKPILDTTVIPGIGADDYALARLFENRRRDAVIADFLKQGQLGVFPYASTKDDLINQLQCDFNHQYTYSFSMGGDSFYTQGNGYYLHDLFTHHHHKSFRVVIFKKYAFVHMQNDEGWVRHYFSIGYSNGFDSSRSFQFPLDTTIQLRYANLFREEAMLEMRKLLVEINYRDSSLTVDSNGRYQLLFYYHSSRHNFMDACQSSLIARGNKNCIVPGYRLPSPHDETNFLSNHTSCYYGTKHAIISQFYSYPCAMICEWYTTYVFKKLED